jgi:diacylglycerol kinase (ATP)
MFRVAGELARLACDHSVKTSSNLAGYTRKDNLDRRNNRMSERRAFTFTGRLRSVRYAFRGVRLMLASQHNAWVHATATVVVIIVGIILHLTRDEWCWITAAVVGVWTAEGLNTAFEFLCDVASPEFHPLVERAKDVAAGAVLISAVGSAVIGLLVFGPHVRAFLR